MTAPDIEPTGDLEDQIDAAVALGDAEDTVAEIKRELARAIEHERRWREKALQRSTELATLRAQRDQLLAAAGVALGEYAADEEPVQGMALLEAAYAAAKVAP